MHKSHLVIAAAASAALSLSACSSVSHELITAPVANGADAPASGARAAHVASCDNVPDLEHPLVVGNYNIKSGVWTSLDEVGTVLLGMNADVIALEEVDRGMKRSGSVDESEVLAKRLGAEHVFAGTLNFDGGTYGIALLSKLPIVNVARFDLPRANGFEPRVAIDATVCAGKTPLHVIAAHADFLPWSSEAQAKAIAQHIGNDRGVVVLGDFNAAPSATGMKGLISQHGDALAQYDEGATFPGTDTRIDYILTSRGVTAAKRVQSKASDHFAVMATINLAPPRELSALSAAN